MVDITKLRRIEVYHLGDDIYWILEGEAPDYIASRTKAKLKLHHTVRYVVKVLGTETVRKGS